MSDLTLGERLTEKAATSGYMHSDGWILIRREDLASLIDSHPAVKQLEAMKFNADFREKVGIKTMDAKWLDTECHKGCQSLVLKHQIEQLVEDKESKERLGELLAEALVTVTEQYHFGGIGGQVDLGQFINRVIANAEFGKQRRCCLCGTRYWQGETVCADDGNLVVTVAPADKVEDKPTKPEEGEA